MDANIKSANATPMEKAVRIIVSVADPDRIILFGSRARGGGEPDGDFDILVLKRGVRDPRRIAQQIYMAFVGIGAPMDVIVEDQERFERLKDDPYLIYREAALKGKVVYEKP